NKANIITIGWAGTICSEPPMVSISVRPSRHSYKLIKESGEFVINIPSKKLAKETDLCGVISGSKCDKFHETGLTPGKSNRVKAPIIMECPINLECKVKQEIPLGSHNMFLAEITSVQVSKEYIDTDGKFLTDKANLLGYAHGAYVSLGKQLGAFGFSVKKK
ncbi:MAG: flavin reductase family protein, partial [Candidatus Riflebacteria bacterium]|nr:flavin reductase family protein [Candidatus Riflebacteria bacterium]